MKTSSWFLIPALGLLASITLAASGHAEDSYKIAALRPVWSPNLIYVGDSWHKDLPKRMQVSLRVANDTPSSSIFVKAYFYDKDAKLIGSYAKPNKIWTPTPKGIEEIGLPATLSHVKNTEVYFAIPEDLQEKKWTTVLVVFGDTSKVAFAALPLSELPKLDFPEKALLAPKTP